MHTNHDTPGFRFVPLPAEPFAPLFALSDAELEARGARRMIAEVTPGYPCRISLEDATPGERVLLLSHLHHDVPGPYRASGPIFVRERAVAAQPAAGELPTLIRLRQLSLRAYDAAGWMLAAEVCKGVDADAAIVRLFEDARVAYLHVHNAKPGCFACRVERA